MDRIFKIEDFMIFNWTDINGRTLKIFVTDDENGVCVSGKDVNNGNIYILYSKVKKEKDDTKTLNDKFFKSVDESIERKLTMKYGEVIKSPSNDEYKKIAEESNNKIKSEPNYMNELLKKYGRN